MADWVKANYTGPQGLPPISYMHPAAGFYLGIDVFDSKACPPMVANPPLVTRRKHLINHLPLHTLLIWDEWFAPTEASIPRERLQNDPNFRQRWEGAVPRDPRHPEKDTCRFVVFERIR